MLEKIKELLKSGVRPYWAYIAGAVFAYLSITGKLQIETVAVVIAMVVTHYFDNRQTDKLLSRQAEK